MEYWNYMMMCFCGSAAILWFSAVCHHSLFGSQDVRCMIMDRMLCTKKLFFSNSLLGQVYFHVAQREKICCICFLICDDSLLRTGSAW